MGRGKFFGLLLFIGWFVWRIGVLGRSGICGLVYFRIFFLILRLFKKLFFGSFDIIIYRRVVFFNKYLGVCFDILDIYL